MVKSNLDGVVTEMMQGQKRAANAKAVMLAMRTEALKNGSRLKVENAALLERWRGGQ